MRDITYAGYYLIVITGRNAEDMHGFMNRPARAFFASGIVPAIGQTYAKAEHASKANGYS